MTCDMLTLLYASVRTIAQIHADEDTAQAGAKRMGADDAHLAYVHMWLATGIALIGPLSVFPRERSVARVGNHM